MEKEGVFIKKEPVVKDGRIDYSKFDRIYIAVKDNNKVYLMDYNCIYSDTLISYPKQRSQISEKDLNDKYINLKDALNNAKFFNKTFVRTTLYTRDNDLRFNRPNTAVLVAVLPDGRSIVDATERNCNHLYPNARAERIPAFYMLQPTFINDHNYILGETVENPFYSVKGIYNTIAQRPNSLVDKKKKADELDELLEPVNE